MWIARIEPSAIRRLAVARLIDNTRHASLIGTAWGISVVAGIDKR